MRTGFKPAHLTLYNNQLVLSLESMLLQITVKPTHHLPLHGTLISLHGIGILLSGNSGCGKTETALSLIQRGACLVCDDAPRYNPAPQSRQFLHAYCEPSFHGRMHLRDIGIINIQTLYPDSVQSCSPLHLEINLQKRQHASIAHAPHFILNQHQKGQWYGFYLNGIAQRQLPALVELVVLLFRQNILLSDTTPTPASVSKKLI